AILSLSALIASFDTAVLSKANKIAVDDLSESIRSDTLRTIADLSGDDYSAFDQDSLALTVQSHGTLATVTAPERNRGYVLSPGRMEKGEQVQEPGLYLFEKTDGSVRASVNGKPFTPIRIDGPPQKLFVLFDAGSTCPGFGCGCWADLELADQCFWTTVCARTGWCPQ
ncbi:MAG: hypothetical protein AAFY56_16970, partial [Pseudomonadota bacterium]